MKIGLYSITYRGVWYRGEALDVFTLMRLAKQQGWEGVELDAERPHAAPMDLSADDRKRLRGLAEDLDLPISAISPNSDFSSPVPVQREAMICYVRECIKLASDLGAPLCKIFAAWRGITLHDGLGSYDLTYAHDPYPYWKQDRRCFVVAAIRELAKVAGDYGITLALQNHGPDIVNNFRDTLSLIEEVGSPHVKACMDINIEDDPQSESRAREIVAASGARQVHSPVNGEFVRDAQGQVVLAGAGYYDDRFWGRKVAYPAYFDALAAAGYKGFFDWEFCHPAMENGAPAGIEYVHNQTQLALEYMRTLRASALSKAAQTCRPTQQIADQGRRDL
jgi:sugar phosphate isomerase/epimerase